MYLWRRLVIFLRWQRHFAWCWNYSFVLMPRLSYFKYLSTLSDNSGFNMCRQSSLEPCDQSQPRSLVGLPFFAVWAWLLGKKWNSVNHLVPTTTNCVQMSLLSLLFRLQDSWKSLRTYCSLCSFFLFSMLPGVAPRLFLIMSMLWSMLFLFILPLPVSLRCEK